MRKRLTKPKHRLLGALAAVAMMSLFLPGCAALDFAQGRLGDRVESLAETYCEQPASVRAVVRVETNRATEDKATIIVACKGEAGYEELRRLYVEPLSESTFRAIVSRLLTEGAYTLPDGTRLRVVVDDDEAGTAEQ